MLTITKRLEFDAAHRIPNHPGQCKNVHGHRYSIEITLRGDLNADGMLADFSDVKRLAVDYVVGPWDHSCIVFGGDRLLLRALSLLPDHKTVIVEKIPTVENLAELAWGVLEPLYARAFGTSLRLSGIRLYETPTCWADVLDGDRTA